MSAPKPICAITGDVHFTPPTLELARESVSRALGTAEELGVSLVLNGDTLDTKDIVRAVCMNALIEVLKEAKVKVYVNTGNHDLINEKGEEHALHFLEPYATVISKPTFVTELESWIIPYQSSAEKMQEILNTIPKGSRLIIHQGVQTAFLRHYVQDKTSLLPEAFADFRVIASHYHRAQDIKCGRPRKGAVGLFSYVGSPYSTTFAEANDGPKGIAVLMDDGTLGRIPFDDFRKHVIVECEPSDLFYVSYHLRASDLLWLKVTGPQSELKQLNKAEIGEALLGHSNFKLDLIPTGSAPAAVETKTLTSEQVLDKLIDNMGETDDQKAYLKVLWREIV